MPDLLIALATTPAGWPWLGGLVGLAAGVRVRDAHGHGRDGARVHTERYA